METANFYIEKEHYDMEMSDYDTEKGNFGIVTANLYMEIFRLPCVTM